MSVPRIATAAGLVLLAFAAHSAAERRWNTDILAETFGYGADTPSDVPLEALMQGCPERDCIPSIDAPHFIAADEADFLGADDLVLGLAIDGAVRAYPTRILDFHEVVNDTVAGKPVAITWCPLCGSGVAFERGIDGKPVQFGVSGLLHESDLVLYDRATESLWQQITGRAFAGPLRGRRLDTVPLAATTWADWRRRHPATEVLSTRTGAARDYGRSAYGDYAGSDRLMFPVSARDPRVHPKTVVHGVELPDDRAMAVTARALREAGVLETEHDGIALRWRIVADGTVIAERVDSGERLVPVRLFWFAWFTFHPRTGLLDAPQAAGTAQDERR